ncbi:hypothetical protein [Humibacter sp.]|uniref:hypothetical protein n=1 Tax=Humibacter sp. TaxID=1940291 RepID=UPI003F7DC33A
MTEAVSLEHDGIVEAPGWFGPSERPLLGWFTYPVSRRVRGAVVLCQPLAEEGNMAYRTFRTLARHLAIAGFLAVRFDYDGTGDSAGDFEDGGRADAWIASVTAAVTEARAWGVEHVSLVGMRLGATLGYVAAAEGRLDLDELVLWDPCVTGRSFLRELQLVHSVWLEGRLSAPAGWVETPSYRFTPEAASGIRRLAIDGRAPVSRLARRTTVVVRADRAPSPQLADAVPAAECNWRESTGQAELLNVPTLHAAVPHEAIEGIVTGLSTSAQKPGVEIRPRLQPCATWRERGHEIQESACLLGHDRLLFGIRTSRPGSHEGTPRIAMFNVAAERHLGEGRTWVRVARALAEDGVTSVRVDHGGVGDSGTRAEHADDAVYAENWIGDVADVVDELSENGRHEVIGVGLCSSGTSVLQAAISGRLHEAIVVNVVFDTDLNARLAPGWTLFPRKPAWLKKFAVRHKRMAAYLWGAWGFVDPRRVPVWTTCRAVARGVDLTVVAGPEDLARLRLNALWRTLWGRPLTDGRRFRTVLVPDADHSLRVSSGQDEVVERIVERVRSRSAGVRS